MQLRVITAGLILLGLCGCGFQLRDEPSLSTKFKALYLDTPKPYSILTRDLMRTLKGSGISLTHSAQQAPISLKILGENTHRTISSVSANTQVREYNLIYSIQYQLLGNNSQTLTEPQVVTTQRNVTVDANQILGSSQEQDVLLNEMRQDSVYKLLKRLDSRDTLNKITG